MVKLAGNWKKRQQHLTFIFQRLRLNFKYYSPRNVTLGKFCGLNSLSLGLETHWAGTSLTQPALPAPEDRREMEIAFPRAC